MPKPWHALILVFLFFNESRVLAEGSSGSTLVDSGVVQWDQDQLSELKERLRQRPLPTTNEVLTILDSVRGKRSLMQGLVGAIEVMESLEERIDLIEGIGKTGLGRANSLSPSMLEYVLSHLPEILGQEPSGSQVNRLLHNTDLAFDDYQKEKILAAAINRMTDRREFGRLNLPPHVLHPQLESAISRFRSTHGNCMQRIIGLF